MGKITVEVHSHDFPVVEFAYVDEADTIERRQAPNDITRRCPTVTVRRTNTGIDDVVSFKFKCAFEEIGALVNVGDWVVVRDAAGVADALAHVSSVVYAVDVDESAGTVTCTGTVTCESWLSLLTKTEVYVPVAATAGSDSLNVGTLFSLDTWAKLIFPTAIEIAGVPVNGATPSVGEALSIFHKTMLRIRLPPSLGGEWLGDAIAVVHNAATSNMYTSGARPVDPVIGSSVGVPRQLRFDFQQTSIYELYNGTWVPDKSLIDMYPALEQGANSDSISAIPGTAAPSALAKALKARPVLFYCMKPYRAEALGKSQMAYAGFDAHDFRVNAALPFYSKSTPGSSGVFSNPTVEQSTFVMNDIFTEVTWRPTVRIPRGAWYGLRFGYDDATRVNVATIGLGVDPGNNVEAAREAGLPIVSRRSVVNHGVRVKKPQWTFQLPTRESLDKPVAYWRTIAAETMQFNVNNHLMSSGKFGMVNADHVTDAERTKFVRLGAGQVFELEVGRQGAANLLGYVTAVETVYVVQGPEAVTATTTVNFERGVAAGNKLAQFGKVPVVSGAESVRAPEDPAATRRTAPPTTGRNQCSSGRAYGTWPTSLNSIVWSKVPENALMEWGEARNFSVNSRLTPDGRNYAVVLLASLYTIETYWRQVHPNAKVDVNWSYRPDTEHGTSHKDGGGADWTLVIDPASDLRLTVFQQWGAINLLATEGRVPLGGRGMYLNLTGTGIKKGLYSDRNDPTADPCNPANAGIALNNHKFPRGGCDNTHYDLRGSFGLTVTRLDGTIVRKPGFWVWANTIGGYSSNYRLWVSGPGGGTELYSIVHPKVKAYIEGAWRFDPHLPGITSDVPNVMQVLGQDDSCFASNIRP